MALDFPPGTPGVTYTGPNGVIWSWDGAKWLAGTSANVYAPIASPAFSGNPTAPTPPVGDADTSLATTQFVSDAVATSLHDVGRNLIHNSMFNIQQRGAGPFTVNGWTADRWFVTRQGCTGPCNIYAIGDSTKAAIGDEAARWQMNNDVVGTSGAGDTYQIVQATEDVRRLAGKTVTLSFTAVTGSGSWKLGVLVSQYFGTGGSPSATTYTGPTPLTITPTWTRYSVTVTLPSIIGKTIGTANNDSTSVILILSQQGGAVGVQSWTLALWGVQLEIGTVATPLEKLDPVTQLQQCQRFFYTGQIVFGGYQPASSNMYVTSPLPVTMRAAPVITPVSNTNNNVGTITWGVNAGNNSINAGAAAVATGTAIINTIFTASADL